MAATSSWFKHMIQTSDTDESLITIIMKDFLSSDILTFLDFVHGKHEVLYKEDIMKNLHIDVMLPRTKNVAKVSNEKSEKKEKIKNEDINDNSFIDDSEDVDIDFSHNIFAKENGFIKNEIELKDEDYDEFFETAKVKKKRKKKRKRYDSEDELEDEAIKLAKPFECSHCTSRFACKEYLTNHLRRVHGESPHVCPICNKTFRRPSELRIHLETVEGVNPEDYDVKELVFR